MLGNAFLRRAGNKSQQAEAVLEAVSRSQAIIEFATDGTILDANTNFLALMGYDLAEVVGRHHRIFVDPAYATGADYRSFWESLSSGIFQAAEYKRLAKGGKEVWIQASYNPVLGRDGKPVKVIKVATDVTAQRLASADWQGQLAAISKSQAVIEFNTKGEVLVANENFCAALGYRLDEIVGRHHRMFVRTEEANSRQYLEFWEALAQGRFQTAEFLRMGKNGEEVWIQASYNPIFDPSGKVTKIVKYATDITARKRAVSILGENLLKISQGELTARIDEKFEGELEQVRLAFNTTAEAFCGIISQLRDTSGALKSATGEILAGANDLSERTTKQAAAIEETSAAVEQLASAVGDTAAQAEDAAGKTQAAAKLADEGGKVMSAATSAMDKISTSSAKISNIIGMIDDIAFQTNLLALNASVEAARAGEAGKGFAVVAVEVRRLAQSAAQASSEVKALIEQSAQEVSGGSKLVAEAAQKLTAILAAVEENSRFMQAISSASREQASSIAEVTAAIRQMDEMTQHNAALVEETNAAIEQTEAQASELDRIVEVFQLEDGARAPRHPTPAAKPARAAAPEPKPTGIKALQHKVKTAAKTYLAQGNAAIDADWEEF